MQLYLVALIETKKRLLFLIVIHVFLLSSVVYADTLSKQSDSTTQQASQVDTADNKSPPSDTKEKIKVEVLISGIEGDLLANAMAFLELRKTMDDEHFSIAWLKKLHKKAEKIFNMVCNLLVITMSLLSAL